jgi:hypothetical protein
MSLKKDTQATQDTTRGQGFIAMHRLVREHWIWEDCQKFQWWVDILMECNYKDRKVPIAGKVIECKRGESLNSLKTWAKRWRVDTGKLRRFFKLLQDDGMITLENVVKTTRLRVCNYDTYNKPQQPNDTQTTGRRHANESQANTNNKDNKDKKGDNAAGTPQTYGSSSYEQSVGPTRDDVRRVFYNNGGTEEMADAFFGKHSATGWRLNNTPIVNYVSLVPTFIKNYLKVEERSGGYTSLTPVNGRLTPNDFV